MIVGNNNVQVTYQEIIDFLNSANSYLATQQKSTSLTYALTKMVKRCSPIIDKFNEEVADLQDKFQKRDKDGVFEYHDEARSIPKFSAENHARFRKEFNALKQKKVEIEPYYAREVPSDMSPVWAVHFVPFVMSDHQR